jgi:hypothetical protein
VIVPCTHKLKAGIAYSNGGNRWNILGFNFYTKSDALSIRYLWVGYLNSNFSQYVVYLKLFELELHVGNMTWPNICREFDLTKTSKFKFPGYAGGGGMSRFRFYSRINTPHENTISAILFALYRRVSQISSSCCTFT